MKKILLIILSAAILVGCSKKNTPSASTITGRWYLTTDSVAEYANGTLYTHSKTTFNHQNYIQFETDGTGQENFIQEAGEGNAVDNAFAIFTYTSSGTTLTLNYPAQTVGTETVDAFTNKPTIKVHTSSNLELYFESDETINGVAYRLVQIDDYIR